MNGSSPHGPLALRAVAAAAVSAAAALVAPLVVPLGAQATAVVNGTLVLGSGPNATALAGQWVVLHRIARDRAGPVDSVRTSVRGAFSVSIPRGDSAAAWMASAERGGVAYFTTLSAANQPVTLSVFDTTSRAIPLRVAGRQIAIAGPAADGSRHVVEALALANDSTVTRIPRDSLPLFVIQVPEVAEQLAIGAGSEVDVPAARLTGPTIALHAAIPPGAKRIVWEYRLPPGHSEFRIAGAQPTASLDLVVADSGATVTGGDMHQGSATVIGGEPALRFFADEVPDPSAIVVRFAATRASTLAFDVGVIGVALILVVGVAIAVLLGRSPGARAAARDASRRAGQVAGACLVAFTFACGEAPRAGGAGASGSAAAITDDYGDTIRVVAAGAATEAQRIVSLNPVATELLFAAGVGARVVGRTRWDMYPSEARAVPDLGDGINPNIEAVVAAKPDLVVLYAGATNVRAARSLRAAGIATVSVRTDRLGDLVRLSRLLAAAMGDSSVAIAADSVASSVAKVRATPPRSDSLRALWYLGEPPIYVIGAGSYMSELLDAAGAVNVFADVEAPSPEVSMEAIIARDPDVIIAGPTAAARLRRSAAWQSLRAVREGRVVVADTALVGRPGVRMGEAARHVRDALAQLPAGAARMGKP